MANAVQQVSENAPHRRSQPLHRAQAGGQDIGAARAEWRPALTHEQSHATACRRTRGSLVHLAQSLAFHGPRPAGSRTTPIVCSSPQTCLTADARKTSPGSRATLRFDPNSLPTQPWPSVSVLLSPAQVGPTAHRAEPPSGESVLTDWHAGFQGLRALKSTRVADRP